MESHEYQLLSQQLDSMTTLVNAQFITVHDRLDGIEKQVTKTNGKVIKREEQIREILIQRERDLSNQIKVDNNHILNCPMSPKLRILEDNAFSTKAVKRWIITSVAVTAGIMSTIFGIIKLIIGLTV
jgi:hypothetical protein